MGMKEEIGNKMKTKLKQGGNSAAGRGATSEKTDNKGHLVH